MKRYAIALSLTGLPWLLTGSAQADLLFYEGFNAAPGTTLENLSTPLGGSGSWVDTSSGTGNSPGTGQDMTVRANGTSGGQLWDGIPNTSTFTHTGGYLEGERRNDNEGHIALAPSVTAQFTDGSTIWLSFVSGSALATGQTDNHHKPNVAIGQGELLDDRAQLANGQAVGAGVAHNTSAGNPRARYWDNEDANPDFEDYLGNSLNRFTPEQLFVAKIEFGATETITVAVFDLDPYGNITESDFNSATQSTITTTNDLNNESFDTLSFHGSRTNYDEIRIATTFEDAVSGVPEPGSLALLGLGGMCLLRRRRD